MCDAGQAEQEQTEREQDTRSIRLMRDGEHRRRRASDLIAERCRRPLPRVHRCVCTLRVPNIDQLERLNRYMLN